MTARARPLAGVARGLTRFTGPARRTLTPQLASEWLDRRDARDRIRQRILHDLFARCPRAFSRQ